MGELAARVTKPVPPLRDGDRLTGAEFLRRYEAMPEGFRAELLNGVVFVTRWVEVGPNGKERLMPPISGGGHGWPQMIFAGWFHDYMMETPHVRPYLPTTVVLSATDTIPEPDALLSIMPEAGGRSALGERGYLYGPPELVIEVANTSAAADLGPKRELYERNGIPEYIVWRTQLDAIDWFRRNRAGRYVAVEADDDGLLRSRVFPGLWLDPQAVFTSNSKRMRELVTLGTATAEHAAFVEKLRRRAGQSRR